MPSIYKPDFFRELYFVFVEKHVRDAVRNGKSSACLRTHEVTVDNVDFHQNVMSFFEEVVFGLVMFGKFGR